MTWLGFDIERAPARNLHPANLKRSIEAVVWHATGGGGSPLGWLQHQAARVSWHFTIERDGRIVQHAGLDERCSHAGGSKLLGRGNVNGRTLGVELSNVGRVYCVNGRDSIVGELPVGEFDPTPYGLRFEGRDNGQRIRLSNPNAYIFKAADGSTWESYPAAQIVAACTLRDRLVAELPVLDSRDAHVGHEQIKAVKWDPGPAFPWPVLLARFGASEIAP